MNDPTYIHSNFKPHITNKWLIDSSSWPHITYNMSSRSIPRVANIYLVSLLFFNTLHVNKWAHERTLIFLKYLYIKTFHLHLSIQKIVISWFYHGRMCLMRPSIVIHHSHPYSIVYNLALVVTYLFVLFLIQIVYVSNPYSTLNYYLFIFLFHITLFLTAYVIPSKKPIFEWHVT